MVDGAAPPTTPEPGTRDERDAEFDRAYRNAHDRLVRIARRHSRDPHGAQDLLQTAAYNAFVRFRSGRPIDNLEAYLTACLFSACMDLHRRSTRQRRSLEQLAASGLLAVESAHEPVLRAAEHENIRAAFERLSPDCRQILGLRVIEGVPVQEVAITLGIPEGTVKSRCSRCLDKLDRLLNG